MADINALADSAQSKLAKGEAIFVADAIRKAIRGKGITHKPDVKRLMSKIGTELKRREYAAKRGTRRSQAHGR